MSCPCHVHMCSDFPARKCCWPWSSYLDTGKLEIERWNWVRLSDKEFVRTLKTRYWGRRRRKGRILIWFKLKLIEPASCLMKDHWLNSFIYSINNIKTNLFFEQYLSIIFPIRAENQTLFTRVHDIKSGVKIESNCSKLREGKGKQRLMPMHALTKTKTGRTYECWRNYVQNGKN